MINVIRHTIKLNLWFMWLKLKLWYLNIYSPFTHYFTPQYSISLTFSSNIQIIFEKLFIIWIIFKPYSSQTLFQTFNWLPFQKYSKFLFMQYMCFKEYHFLFKFGAFPWYQDTLNTCIGKGSRCQEAVHDQGEEAGAGRLS